MVVKASGRTVFFINMIVELTYAQLRYLHFLEAHKAAKEEREYLSTNAAYARFGRGNVDRWVRMGKVRKYLRPGKTEMRLTDLTNAAEVLCDTIDVSHKK